MDFQNVYKIVLKSKSAAYSVYAAAYTTSEAISKVRDSNNFDEVIETKLEVSDVLV